VVGYTTSGGVLGPPVAYSPATVSVSGNSVVLAFPASPAAGSLPDESCYHITLGEGLTDPPLAGDLDVWVRSLYGDTTVSGLVNLSDAILTRTRLGQAAAAQPAMDVDLSGGTIDNADALAIKSRVSSPPHEVICPSIIITLSN
jgi:hypothetical protein